MLSRPVVAAFGAVAMVSTAASPLVDTAATVVAAFLGTSFSTLLTTRATRRQIRTDTLVSDVRVAQDLLNDVHSGHRLRAARHPAAPSELALAALADDLRLAATRTLNDAVVLAVGRYVTHGGGQDRYEAALDALARCLRESR